MQEVLALPDVSEESKQPEASLHGPAFPCYIYDTYLCLQRSWFSEFLMLRSGKVIVKAEVQDCNVYDLCSFFWCILHKECQYQDVTYINIACRWAWMLFQKTTWLKFTLCRKLWLFPLFPKRASSRRPACMGPPFHVTFMIHIYAYNVHGSQSSSCWDPGRWLSRQKSKIAMSMIYVLSFDVYCIKSANIKMLHISTSLVAELECFSKKQPGLSSLYAGSCGSSPCFRREQAATGQLAWARLSMLHLWYIFMLTTFMVLSVPHVEILEGDCEGRSPRLECLWSMFFLLMYIYSVFAFALL